MGSNLVNTPKRKFPAEIAYQREAMMNRHKHNGLYGAAIAGLHTLNSIQQSPTVTEKTKTMAAQIAVLQAQLIKELYDWRVEPNGDVVAPTHTGSHYKMVSQGWPNGTD